MFIKWQTIYDASVYGSEYANVVKEQRNGEQREKRTDAKQENKINQQNLI